MKALSLQFVFLVLFLSHFYELFLATYHQWSDPSTNSRTFSCPQYKLPADKHTMETTSLMHKWKWNLIRAQVLLFGYRKGSHEWNNQWIPSRKTSKGVQPRSFGKNSIYVALSLYNIHTLMPFCRSGFWSYWKMWHACTPLACLPFVHFIYTIYLYVSQLCGSWLDK